MWCHTSILPSSVGVECTKLYFFWLVTLSENLTSFCCSIKERKPWWKFQANYQESGQFRNDSFAIQQLIDCTVNFPSRWNTCNLQTYIACSRNGTVEMYNSFQYHHQTVLRNTGRFGFFNIRLIRKIWWLKSHVLKKRLMKGSRKFLGDCINRVLRMASDFSTS